ncbi:hypothetical protein V2J09_018993 [Rumex salicifolius]
MTDKAWLWHARYGHLNFQALRRLSSQNMVEGMPEIAQANQVCDGLLDPSREKVIVSRDVIFEEEKGWSWKSDQETTEPNCEGTFTVPLRQGGLGIQNEVPMSNSQGVDGFMTPGNSVTSQTSGQNTPQSHLRSSSRSDSSSGSMTVHRSSEIYKTFMMQPEKLKRK